MGVTRPYLNRHPMMPSFQVRSSNQEVGFRAPKLAWVGCLVPYFNVGSAGCRSGLWCSLHHANGVEPCQDPTYVVVGKARGCGACRGVGDSPIIERGNPVLTSQFAPFILFRYHLALLDDTPVFSQASYQ
jgi:hypothetical protein